MCIHVCIYIYKLSVSDFIMMSSIIQFYTYIIMELLEGGELLDRIRSQQSFTEAEASGIMKQLVSVVNHLHNRRIVHRDLKPEVG